LKQGKRRGNVLIITNVNGNTIYKFVLKLK
jgi:hypothetical protein